MTAVQPAGPASASGYEHVALVHDGPDDLARRMAAPLRAGLESGEAVFVCLAGPAWESLAARIGPVAAEATVMAQGDRYASPGKAMAGLHRFVDTAVARGAPAAWSIGTLPFDGTPEDARWWRYEAAVDEVLRHHPLRAICTYDRSTMTPEQLDGVHRTHAWIDAAGGRRASDAYGETWDALSGSRPAGPPTVEVAGDHVGRARNAVESACGPGLPTARLDDLLLIVSELVTNSVCHGLPPIRVRAWDLPDQVVVQVTDAGQGVGDVYADLRAPRGGAHGHFGLWLVGQVAQRLSIDHDEGGTVVTACLWR